MRRAPVLALLVVLACAGTASAAPRLSPVGVFTQPVFVTAPPGDPHRLFVVEKQGTVKVVLDGGAPTTFLDIQSEVDSQGEKGLLSMAFAPDYASSGRFYIYFTAYRPGDPDGSVVRIDELHRSDTNAQVADTSRRRTLLAIQHPDFGNHDGGQLQTGPDGMLWIGTGDGGGGNDPGNNAENTGVLLGKILRIDPQPSSTAPYTIPAGNPFANGAAGAPEVWAYGLRNPWRFSFDRQTGDLTIGDVGQGAREEIDFAPGDREPGVNYGWRCMEGSQPTPGLVPPCTPTGTYAPPVFDYSHAAGRCSLTGGYVVRHPDLPTLAGRYLYGDFCTGELRSVVLAKPSASGDRDEGLAVASLSSFGEDSCGHIYAVSLGGTVNRIDDAPFTPCPEPPGDGASPGPGGSGDSGGSAAGPAGGQGADETAPKLSLSRARRQRIVAKGRVYVGVKCGEDCGVTTGAVVSVPRRAGAKRYALPDQSRMVPGRTRVRLKLKLSRAARLAIARQLATGSRPLLRIVVTARDAARNQTRSAVHVRAVG